MKTFAKTLAVALGAAAFAAGPALAVTVTNQSDKAWELTADLGEKEPKTKIDAGKSAKIECPEGCELRINSGNSYGLSATAGDKVVVGKDGMLAHSDAADKEAKNETGKSGSKTSAN